jgi:hypothetical protein
MWVVIIVLVALAYNTFTDFKEQCEIDKHHNENNLRILHDLQHKNSKSIDAINLRLDYKPVKTKTHIKKEDK